MCRIELKLLIVTIICGTVTCQYGEYYGNPGAIMFPGPVSPNYNGKLINNRQSSFCANCQNIISRSLSIAKEINELDSFDDFLDYIQSKPGAGRDKLLSTRIGDRNERSNAVQPTAGKCKPELQIIPFRDEDTHPSIIYFPSCTRIKRCGGCCNANLWSCQPTNTTMTNYKVLKSQLTSNGNVDFLGEEIIPLEEHLSCQCQCKIKSESCTNKQEYIADECRCECINDDEKTKCKNNYETKIWNSEDCTCICRKRDVECHTGSYFDDNTCRCEKIINLQITQTNNFNGRKNNENDDTERTNPQGIVILRSATDPRRRHKDEK